LPDMRQSSRAFGAILQYPPHLPVELPEAALSGTAHIATGHQQVNHGGNTVTRYAIVRENGRYYAVPERQADKWEHLHCFYTGHIEAAHKFAKSCEESERKDGATNSMRRIYAGDSEKRRSRKKGIAYGKAMDEADRNAEPISK
jgi:hypothetical protein